MSTLPDIQIAAEILSGLRAYLEGATLRLAQDCSLNGKLNAAKLDQQQVPSFELAWASAEMLAAESSLETLTADTFELNRRLVAIFAARTITQVRDRLEKMLLDMDHPEEGLLAIIDDPAVRSFRRSCLCTRFLQDTANMMVQQPTIIGQIPMTEELSIMQDMFSRFANNAVAPLAEKIHRQDLIVPEKEILEPLRELGVFGLSIPEKYGGTAPGMDDTLSMIVVTEALSKASLGAAGSLITRPEILSRALMTGGTEEQKKHWLPRLAKGDPLCAVAITEPDYGSDVAGVTLHGTRCEGGWLLNGAKSWCTLGGKAGVVMVVTRTDPDRSKGYRGLTLMLVEKPSYDGHEFDYTQEGGGHLSGRAIATIGYRGMHSFDLWFDDYFVPDANVIGGEDGLGKGFYYTMSGMVGGRMQTAARANGVLNAALQAALRYAQERKVFDAPLIDYPLTCAKLAHMGASCTASRFLAYSVAHMVDQGSGTMEASLVKLFACRSAEMVANEALQIHGGMGYAEETAVSRYFVDARVLSIFEGAEEVLALKVIARNLMDKALKSAESRR